MGVVSEVYQDKVTSDCGLSFVGFFCFYMMRGICMHGGYDDVDDEQ